MKHNIFLIFIFILASIIYFYPWGTTYRNLFRLRFFLPISIRKESTITLTVLLIIWFILIYSSYYINEKYEYFFTLVLIRFGFSILLLLLSNSPFLIFCGWDLLGVTSFFLVIFYENWKRLNGAIVTLITNRLGDAFLIIRLGTILFQQYFTFGGIFFILAALTKRAQTPFSAWLPLAMAAPTPIRSLVHSSTLVTAGIVLVLKIKTILSVKYCVFRLIIASRLTLFLAGSRALSEIDFKKIVALSTLSQIALVFVILTLGLHTLAFFHIIIHAFFKSGLFTVTGVIIHSLFSSQEFRFSSRKILSPMLKTTLFIFILSLTGLFFTSGFYSKDLFLDFLAVSASPKYIAILISIIIVFTFVYTYTLLKTTWASEIYTTLGGLTSYNLWLSTVLLSFSSLIVGGLFSKLHFGCFLKNRIILKVIFFLGVAILIIRVHYIIIRKIWYLDSLTKLWYRLKHSKTETIFEKVWIDSRLKNLYWISIRISGIITPFSVILLIFVGIGIIFIFV